MFATDFEYDGINLSNKGFMVCTFGTSPEGIKTASNGSQITFETVPMMNGTRHDLLHTNFNECISTTFQICKHPEIGDRKEISIYEERDIMRWLNRRQFKKFRILDEGYCDFYFESSFNIHRILFNDVLVGFELKMITNRPFALADPISIKILGDYENWKKCVPNISDEIGHIYPSMRIEILQDGHLEIINHEENRKSIISNCKAGELITLKYPIIESSDVEHRIQNDFNWVFFRLVNTLSSKLNNITVSLPCSIQLTYSPIVKVGI